MKEFLKSQKVTYNLMSFTAFKSLLLFSYLLEKPRSYQEIRDYFESHSYLNETISIDTLRVYINSLERIGCEIKRSKKSEGSKYKIISQPFALKFSENQIKSLISVYKTIIKNIDIEELVSLTKFFKKIAVNVDSEELKTTLENISPLSKIDPEILNSLIEACKNKAEITITYNSPHSGIKLIDVLAENISISNNKIYLFGTSPNYKNTAGFIVSRITQKPIAKIQKTIDPNKDNITATYILYDKKIPLENYENIISENENSYTIEMHAKNLFYARQRILYLGSDCKVIAPTSFKEDIISTLNKMRGKYAE